jgi:WD40 repeat protein
VKTFQYLTIILFAILLTTHGYAQDNQVDQENIIHITAVAWKSDGSQVAAVGVNPSESQGYLSVRDVNTGEPIFQLAPNPGGFTSVAWSPDDRYLAVGSFDQTIWIIDLETQSHIATLWGHQATVSGLDWNSDGTELVSSGSWDGLTILWDMITYEPIRNIEEGNLFPFSAAFSPDDQRIAIGGEAGVRIHNLDASQSSSWYFQNTNAGSLVWSPEGTRIAFGTQVFPSVTNPNLQNFAQIYVFDSRSGTQMNNFATQDQTIYGIAWSPDGELIATYSIDGSVSVWSTPSLVE